jgi:hypothetical protein
VTTDGTLQPSATIGEGNDVTEKQLERYYVDIAWTVDR